MLHILTESRHGEAIEIAVGDTLDLTLPETPSTGYTWTAGTDSGETLKLLRSSFDPSTTTPGAGGVRHLIYQAQAPGQALLSANLDRPWTNDPIKQFELNVKVIAE
ncbi:protease inhibitor I42 family protein [Kribbella sp. NPDC051718]|uniref:protease inhibitor I42 family protein n=1 Tax=Kribbella sp. NPDC051718 TaxID=3155168 RepID=UPI0034333F1D